MTTLEPLDTDNARCLRRLASRRCRRDFGRACSCSLPLAALDHARVYKFADARVIVAAPYQLDAAALDVLAAVVEAEGLAFAVGEEGTGPYADELAEVIGRPSTHPVVIAKTPEVADEVAEALL